MSWQAILEAARFGADIALIALVVYLYLRRYWLRVWWSAWRCKRAVDRYLRLWERRG